MRMKHVLFAIAGLALVVSVAAQADPVGTEDASPTSNNAPTAAALAQDVLAAPSHEADTTEQQQGVKVTRQGNKVTIIGPPPPASQTTRIAMRTAGGAYVVPVLINSSITLDFFVDSGASDVTIPADIVLKLIQTGTVSGEDFIGRQTYRLADGSTMPSAIFRIRSLQVGDKVLENVRGSVTPVSGGLLLGQSFLGRFSAWSIDNANHQLLLGSPGH